MTRIEFHVGDKVIRADGLSGKITAVFDDRTDEKSPIAKISYENGETVTLGKADEQNGFKMFYLIGATVFGNKIPVASAAETLKIIYYNVLQQGQKPIFPGTRRCPGR